MTTTATNRSNRKKKDTEEDKKKDLDLFQIVDKDNKPILCHACSQSAESSSGGLRPIMPCGLCGLWWHLDCLNPPRAHPPNPKTWVCPCHIDNLLTLVPAQLGPAHKFRKIKGASDINYAFRRGNINNGWIEVDDDLSEDEAKRTQIGLRDPGSFGKKYVLSASGIRDDFIAAYVPSSMLPLDMILTETIALAVHTCLSLQSRLNTVRQEKGTTKLP